MSRTRKDDKDYYKNFPWLAMLFRWHRGQGKFWKRQLSKARRRSYKDTHQRGLARYERECNWKGW